MTFSVIFCGAFTFVFLMWIYIKWSQKYWTRRNVPHIEVTSVFGNTGNPFNAKHSIATMIKFSYDEFKRRGHKSGGIYSFTTPFYIPVDTNLIKRMLITDFPHFMGHGLVIDEEKDPLAAHLFNLDGTKWRNMRVKLTPTFTSGKMKMMFNTLVDCGDPMIDHIGKLADNNKPVNIKEILSCYTTDVIGSCAFGLDCNSFNDPNAEFRTYCRKSFAPTIRNVLKLLEFFLLPAMSRILYVKFVTTEIETFFINVIKNIIDQRKVQGIKRNDFIQIFVEMQEKAKSTGEEPLTLEEVTAQAYVFFLAGYETSSTTMSFCLHELAFNQDIQTKLRDEVRATLKRSNGQLSYDAIMEMKYMDQVVNETLRKYPPAPMINRVCSLEYKVPGTDIILEKDTKVIISTLGLHRDEEFYPDPDKFDPERFNEENTRKRPDFTFLPFGEGPRICIGLRFGLMQTKTGLSMLLNNYRFFPVDGDTYSINFDPRSFILTKKGNVMLAVERI